MDGHGSQICGYGLQNFCKSKLRVQIYIRVFFYQLTTRGLCMCLSSHRENQLTQEQEQILNHNTEGDHVVKIMAFAGESLIPDSPSWIYSCPFKVVSVWDCRGVSGTGKTTTLVCYAKQRPELRFLYVVFNKAVHEQAERIFPDNVSCKTFHSLAFAAVGQR